MELWKIWLIGIVIAIITRIAVTLIYGKNKQAYVGEFKEVIVQLLIIICIVIEFGMPIGELLGRLLDFTFSIDLLFAFVFAIATYFIAFLVLGLYNIKYKLMQILYLFAFALSVVAYTGQTVDYQRNVEEIPQKVLEETKTENLLYFCNISLQTLPTEEPEHFSLENVKSVLDNICKSNMVTYCYTDQKDTLLCDVAPKQCCRVTYIKSNQTPYVEIYSYYEYTKLIDHRNNTETIKKNTEKRWNEYTFYLPASIIQYAFSQN